MPGILSMSSCFTGKMAFNDSFGVMRRPSFNFLALMKAQSFFVTSVRAIFLPPQIAARAGLKFTGANKPMPFFFAARLAFLLPAFRLRFTSARFAAIAFFDNGFFTVFVVVVGTVVFVTVVFTVVVVVIAVGWSQTHTSLEP